MIQNVCFPPLEPANRASASSQRCKVTNYFDSAPNLSAIFYLPKVMDSGLVSSLVVCASRLTKVIGRRPEVAGCARLNFFGQV